MKRSGGSRKRKSLEGRYANQFQIGVNESELVLDFGQCYSEGEPAWFHTRIIIAPLYAQALLETLAGAVANFEKITHENTRSH